MGKPASVRDYGTSPQQLFCRPNGGSSLASSWTRCDPDVIFDRDSRRRSNSAVITEEIGRRRERGSACLGLGSPAIVGGDGPLLLPAVGHGIGSWVGGRERGEEEATASC
jgi:hypothetical protein